MIPTPKRRWSFSLRTLFVVVTVVAVAGLAYRTFWPQPVFPDSATWEELNLHGTLHNRQRQAERVGIRGPHDRMREMSWDRGEKVSEGH
jgi:hypothetical protein